MATMNDWNEWATHLAQAWLDQDENFLNELEAMITRAIESAPDSPPETLRQPALTSAVADYIRDYIESGKPELEPSLYVDFIDALMSEVDYTEIAQAYIADYDLQLALQATVKLHNELFG